MPQSANVENQKKHNQIWRINISLYLHPIFYTHSESNPKFELKEIAQQRLPQINEDKAH